MTVDNQSQPSFGSFGLLCSIEKELRSYVSVLLREGFEEFDSYSSFFNELIPHVKVEKKKSLEEKVVKVSAEQTEYAQSYQQKMLEKKRLALKRAAGDLPLKDEEIKNEVGALIGEELEDLAGNDTPHKGKRDTKALEKEAKKAAKLAKQAKDLAAEKIPEKSAAKKILPIDKALNNAPKAGRR